MVKIKELLKNADVTISCALHAYCERSRPPSRYVAAGERPSPHACPVAPNVATLSPMSEPTLKHVLDAIAEIAEGQTTLAARVDKIDAKVDAHRAETAALRAEMATLRNETQQGFAALDRQLAGHSVITHRALEERIEKIEARLPALRPAPRAPRRR